jgi:hypothetical protein
MAAVAVWTADHRHPSGGSHRPFITSANQAARTFVTRLAENPAVSKETIRQLAGHVSPRMPGRYADVRVQAGRAAIATLEGGVAEPEGDVFESASPQLQTSRNALMN